MEREIEDLDAVIAEAGGTAHVFGASSGGGLALEAAATGLPIDRLARITQPTLVMTGMVADAHGGGVPPEFMARAAYAIAASIPNAERAVVEAPGTCSTRRCSRPSSAVLRALIR